MQIYIQRWFTGAETHLKCRKVYSLNVFNFFTVTFFFFFILDAFLEC